MEGITTDSSDLLKRYQFLWEEYKYRHDLIWQRLYRFTAAVVLISVIPYLRDDIARKLGYTIVIAPLLAVLLAGYVLLVMRNELAIFDKIKLAYRQLQNELFAGYIKHDLDAPSSFGRLVMWYLGILVLLAILNGFIVGLALV